MMTSTYFTQLNQSLKDYNRAIPMMLVDLDILDQNIDHLTSQWHDPTTFRVVVKSLPSPQLVSYVLNRAKTNKLMVFHQPFLTDIIGQCNHHTDILLGKPMPIKTAIYFYNNLSSDGTSFNPYSQIQWLVDSPNRINEYISLARKLNKKLRLNVEIDVGLHRGGFEDLQLLKKGLSLINDNSQYIGFAGFMGYDPHVVKLPRIVRSREKAHSMANAFYNECISLVQSDFPGMWHPALTLNGAGSPTIELHQLEQSPLNDMAAGSCLMKPTDFDIPTLSNYQPALFIATPIIKKMECTMIPGLEKMKWVLNINKKQTFFTYGGYWKADYCYPPGLRSNSLYGESTNQSMLQAPKNAKIEIDDFVFLRPKQSEFVMLQFGNILTVRNGQLTDEWQLLKNY